MILIFNRIYIINQSRLFLVSKKMESKSCLRFRFFSLLNYKPSFRGVKTTFTNLYPIIFYQVVCASQQESSFILVHELCIYTLHQKKNHEKSSCYLHTLKDYTLNRREYNNSALDIICQIAYKRIKLLYLSRFVKLLRVCIFSKHWVKYDLYFIITIFCNKDITEEYNVK